jgi:hypothetical protein
MDYKYIYAPSGAEKKAERERFYTNDLPHLLTTTKSDMLLAGDFNYILKTNNDSTGQKHFSRALASTVNELIYTMCGMQHQRTRDIPTTRPKQRRD